MGGGGWFRRLGCALALGVLAGCSGNGGGAGGGATGGTSGGNSNFMTMGMLGNPSLAVIVSNLVFADAAINSSGGNAVVIDSGSPVVLLNGDPGVFSGLSLPATQQVTVDFAFLDTGGTPIVTIDNIPAIQLTTQMGTVAGLAGLAGIMGGDVLRDFSVQLDYAAPMMKGFCLGCSAGPRDDVSSPGTAIAFTLAGGGGQLMLNGDASAPVSIPATRIPVTVSIDGTDTAHTHTFILDTGASEVTVTSAVYQSLIADGRAQLAGGLAISTVANNMEGGSVTRAKTITVGGETVLDAPVLTVASDQLLGSLGTELGHPVDGLLGGSYLRNFLVTIDYPGGQLHLQRYATPPIADEFRRVGFMIAPSTDGSTFAVTHVYPGSDAATEGVAAGDQVLAINGTTLDPKTQSLTADGLLDGTPGTTIPIQFGTTTSAALANKTVDLRVDDLIPNPQ